MTDTINALIGLAVLCAVVSVLSSIFLDDTRRAPITVAAAVAALLAITGAISLSVIRAIGLA